MHVVKFALLQSFLERSPSGDVAASDDNRFDANRTGSPRPVPFPRKPERGVEESIEKGQIRTSKAEDKTIDPVAEATTVDAVLTSLDIRCALAATPRRLPKSRAAKREACPEGS